MAPMAELSPEEKMIEAKAKALSAQRMLAYEQASMLHVWRYGIFEQINEITRIVLNDPKMADLERLHRGLASITGEFKHIKSQFGPQ